MAKFATKEPQVQRLARGPDAVLNHEGALAFTHDPKSTLAHMAACCLVHEEAFYEDSTSRIDDLVRTVAEHDPQWLVRLAIYIRGELHLRSMPVRIAAIAATVPECRDALLKGAARILRRPDDLLEFAALLKDNRHGLSQTLPAVAKAVIAAGLNDLDELRAIKYRRGKSFGLKHLLKLAHPAPASRRQSLLFSYLLDPARWQLMPQEDRALLPKIAAYETLKRLPKKHYQMARRIVRDHALPWELVMPLLGSDRESWKTIAPAMPVMALTRNLRTLIASGALGSPAVRDAVIEKLSDPDVIRSSRMLPFRWLSARDAVRELMKRPEHRADAAIAAKLDDALNGAIEISVQCLPRWPGRTALACDLSGSMSWTPISRHSKVLPADIASILVAAAHRLCEESVVLAFGSEIAVLSLDPEGGLLANAEQVRKTDVGAATYAYKVLEELVRRRDRVDRIVILTDMEVYGESRVPRDSEDIRAWLARYRREVNRDVELYIVNLAAYGHFVTPQQEPKVTCISGWSEGILRYVAASRPGVDIVEETGAIDL